MIGTIIENRFTLTEIIADSAFSTVYRATDHVHGVPVAVKVLKPEYISKKVEDYIRFKNDCLTAGNLHHPNLITVHKVIEFDSLIVIIMEYLPGHSLTDFIYSQSSPIDIEGMLDIAIPITRGLDRAHRLGIVHTDIKPGNIIVGAAADIGNSRRAVITDFGIAHIKDFAALQSRPDHGNDPESIIAAFGYTAPELFQSGEKRPDMRSDLYAMGALIYQLLTGKPPFSGDDIPSIMHQHLARIPEPPSALNASIPPALDRILERLLCKDPDRRYQNAAAVLRDLERIRAGDLQFDPQHNDRASLPGSATSLIARSEELGRLVSLAEKAAFGSGSLCLITGEAGIGKTRLANEAATIIAKRHILFLDGTCVQDGGGPYGAFSDALGKYMRFFQGYDEQKRKDIRTGLRKALREFGGLTVKLHPSLIALFDEPLSTVSLEPDREKKRFLMVCANFLFTLAKIEGGMTLVLDDVHWADEGTLSLINELLPGIRESRLLILALYRDTDINHGHGIYSIIRASRENRGPAMVMRLRPFERNETADLIAAILHRDSGTLSSIIDLVHAKGRGNPLFIREIIKQITPERIVNAGAVSGPADLDAIRESDIPETIVDILLQRISLLGAEERAILSFAAAIGKRFSETFLTGMFAGSDSLTIADRVIDAINRARQLQLIRTDETDGEWQVFLHDSIREILYQRIDPDRRKEIHGRIARRLESIYEERANRNDAGPEQIYEIAAHYLRSGEPLPSIRYSFPAAIAAREQYAYEDAINYLSWSLLYHEHLPPAQRDEKQLMLLYRTIGELYVSIGKNDAAITIFTDLLGSIDPAAEKAPIYKQLCLAFYKKGDYRQCERFGEQGLSLLGERLPRTSAGLILSIAIQRLLRRMIRINPFHRRSASGSDTDRLIIWIYYTLFWSYVVTDERKLARTIYRMANIAACRLAGSREHALATALYAAMNATTHHFERSIEQHREALALRRSLQDHWGIAQSHQLTGYSYFFNGMISEAIREYDAGLEIFQRIGDLKEAGNSLAGKIWCFMIVGDYPRVNDAVDRYQKIADTLKDDLARCHALHYRGAYCTDTGDFVQAQKYFNRASIAGREHGFWGILCITAIELGKLNILLNAVPDALSYFDEARGIAEAHHLIIESIVNLDYEIADAHLEDYLRSSPRNKEVTRSALALIKRMCARAVKQARRSPLHYGGALRVTAKYHALIGRTKKAERLFLQSIQILRSVHFACDLSRSLYEYGLFLHRHGRTTEGRSNILDAYTTVKEIGNRAYIIKPARFLGIGEDAAVPSRQNFYLAAREHKKIQSLIELVKKSRADMPLADFLDHALHILLEIAGAASGYIMLVETNGGPPLVTAANINNPAEHPIMGPAAHEALRTGCIIPGAGMLDDAAPAITAHTPTEPGLIAAIPLIYTDAVIGVCCLENRLMDRSYSRSDIDTIQLIVDQIAVKVGPYSETKTPKPELLAAPTDTFCADHGITRREREIISLMVKGYTRKGISEQLGISYATADVHIKNIYAKIGVNSKAELIERIGGRAVS